MTEVMEFDLRAGRRDRFAHAPLAHAPLAHAPLAHDRFEREALGSVRAEAGARRAAAGCGNLSRLLGMAWAPAGAAADSVRAIRAALMASGFSRGGSFALVAPQAGQGASVLAANLALAFAQLEMNTLLVDANLRRPGLASLFGVSERREGLAECLEGALARQATAPPYLKRVAAGFAPHLTLLPAGAAPANPHDLLASGAFARLAAHWAEEFDLVIYDAPAALGSADAALVASRAGSAVIAARRDAARFDDLRRVGAALRAHGCAIAGVVGLGWTAA